VRPVKLELLLLLTVVLVAAEGEHPLRLAWAVALEALVVRVLLLLRGGSRYD
jgi:hypothetical protein